MFEDAILLSVVNTDDAVISDIEKLGLLLSGATVTAKVEGTVLELPESTQKKSDSQEIIKAMIASLSADRDASKDTNVKAALKKKSVEKTVREDQEPKVAMTPQAKVVVEALAEVKSGDDDGVTVGIGGATNVPVTVAAAEIEAMAEEDKKKTKKKKARRDLAAYKAVRDTGMNLKTKRKARRDLAGIQSS